ncbi:hypothetical protein [Flagellimonas sp.]|uniref:hypothetical protein n=1 Tax=Flagellimonas sp. TaxID=2058762 RepID=UPI003F49C299
MKNKDYGLEAIASVFIQSKRPIIFSKALISIMILSVGCSSCKKEDKEALVNSFVRCARVKERCENRDCPPPPGPTQNQLDLIAICYSECTSGNFGDNSGTTSPGLCQAFCENLVLGNNPPSGCDKKCDEEFYECFLGEDWEDIVKTD